MNAPVVFILQTNWSKVKKPKRKGITKRTEKQGASLLKSIKTGEDNPPRGKMNRDDTGTAQGSYCSDLFVFIVVSLTPCQLDLT